MAVGSQYSLLSLDRWAKIFGVNPAHFNGVYHADVMHLGDGCADVWYQHEWQSPERASREDVLNAILSTEEDIARYLGFYPAPRWLYQEVHQYPQYHRVEFGNYGMVGASGLGIPVRATYGYVIAPGQRAITTIGTGEAVTYSDADGDGHVDTATVTHAVTTTDPREIKVFVANHGGQQQWEIRPSRTKAIAAGTFTATYWPWQFVNPAYWEALTTDVYPSGLDFLLQTVPGTYDYLSGTCDIFREYNDTTAVSSTLYWEPSHDAANCECGGTGCTACLLTTQDGCLHVSDSRNGLVVPAPAEYDDNDAAWGMLAPAIGRDPDFVKISYYAGLLSELYKNRTWMDPLSDWWAQTIAYMAAARLEKPVCSCPMLTRRVEQLQTDLAFYGEGGSYNVGTDLNNPFGTRKGEVYAWRRVKGLAEKRAKVAVL